MRTHVYLIGQSIFFGVVNRRIHIYRDRERLVININGSVVVIHQKALKTLRPNLAFLAQNNWVGLMSSLYYYSIYVERVHLKVKALRAGHNIYCTVEKIGAKCINIGYPFAL